MAEKNKYPLLPNLHPSLTKTLANLAGNHLSSLSMGWRRLLLVRYWCVLNHVETERWQEVSWPRTWPPANALRVRLNLASLLCARVKRQLEFLKRVFEHKTWTSCFMTETSTWQLFVTTPIVVGTVVAKGRKRMRPRRIFSFCFPQDEFVTRNSDRNGKTKERAE